MSQASLEVVYDGPDLATGFMEVADLAPALLGVAEACQRANQVWNEGRATLSVRVQANVRHGSFHVDLNLVQSVTASTPLLPAAIQSAQHITAKLFTDAKSVFNLLELLKGKKPEIVSSGKGNIAFIIPGDNNEVTVDSGTYNVLVDSETKRSLAKALRPVYKMGINKVEIGTPDRKTVATKKELPYFSEAPSSLEVATLERVVESEREAVLAVLTFATQENQKITLHRWRRTILGDYRRP